MASRSVFPAAAPAITRAGTAAKSAGVLQDQETSLTTRATVSGNTSTGNGAAGGISPSGTAGGQSWESCESCESGEPSPDGSGGSHGPAFSTSANNCSRVPPAANQSLTSPFSG